MELNLISNLKGQAKKMANVIKNMSPKIKDVQGFTMKDALAVTKGKVQRKVDKYAKGDNTKILHEKILAVLKDRESKEFRYKQQDKLAKESIYGVLLDQFMEDAFGIDPDDKIVSIDILDDDVSMRELLEVFSEDLLQRTHLDELLTDYLKNTYLKYGELFFKKYYNNKGMLIRLEVMDGKYVYPICSGAGVQFYIVINPLTNDFDIVDEDEILAFQLNPELKPIVCSDSKLEQLLSEESDEFKSMIPDSYKIGTPLLYNARRELSNLRVANLLTDLAQLKSLAMPTILGVNVENIRDEEQLSELIDTYEEYLEDIIELPDLNLEEDTDIESLINTSFKAIPVEGSGKNGLTDLSISSGETSSDTDYLNKKKEDVALASGFPISALTAQSDANSKADLSSNRRYRNKCKAAQRFIVRPIRTEVLVDFAIQNIDVSPEQVKVFCKPIVSLDTAEDLEISLGAITQASQVFEALVTIQDNSRDYEIDEDGYVDYFNTLLGNFKGAQQLLKKKEAEADISNDKSDNTNEEEQGIESPFTDRNQSFENLYEEPTEEQFIENDFVEPTEQLESLEETQNLEGTLENTETNLEE